MPAPPTGLAVSADGKTLFVTCAAPESQVCVVDVAQARVTARLPAGHSAVAPVLSPDGKTLFVCNRFNDDVSVFDLATRKETAPHPGPARAGGGRASRPMAGACSWPITCTPAARMPSTSAAVVSVIDTALGQVVDELWLPNGSGSLNDLRISPDGKYAVVTHILARFHLPTTQLDRGWMNTNAKTLIDLDRMEVVNTVLLDTVDRGAANPWGVAWSADGKTLVVALAGTHEVSVTDFPALLAKLAKLTPALPADAQRSLSRHRLPGALRRAQRSVLPGRPARAAASARRRPRPARGGGGRPAWPTPANYFSDTLSAFELDGPYPKAESIPLGPEAADDRARGRASFTSTTRASASRAGKAAPAAIPARRGWTV